MRQQCSTDAGASCFGPDEQIFEVHPWATQKSREVRKKQRESDGAPVETRDNHLSERTFAEQGRMELVFSRHDCIRQLFVCGKLADKRDYQRNVPRGAGPYFYVSHTSVTLSRINASDDGRLIDPAPADDNVLIVKDDGLPWSDGHDRLVKLHSGAPGLEGENMTGRRRVTMTNLRGYA